MKIGDWLTIVILPVVLWTGAAWAQPVHHITLLTYNVRGLPWPVATDRPAALDAIAEQLSALRRSGLQPDMVALQEAFIPEAKAIGRKAGYRYAAFGPGIASAPQPVRTAQDRAFLSEGGFMAGENSGKRVDSGLVIFSDYPIVRVRRTAYAVCAGYDCLANKGALAVQVVVPGLSVPLTVVDSHLNSNKASGATPERSTYAYRRQVDALKAFVRSVTSVGSPVLVAGDFNAGNRPERRDYFIDQILGNEGLLAAEHTCGPRLACTGGSPGGVAESIRRGRDWLLYRPSRSLSLSPISLTALFGRAADGSMLSDHIGVAVTYAFGPLSGSRPSYLEIASR